MFLAEIRVLSLKEQSQATSFLAIFPGWVSRGFGVILKTKKMFVCRLTEALFSDPTFSGYALVHDIFMVWTEGEEGLATLLGCLGSPPPCHRVHSRTFQFICAVPSVPWCSGSAWRQPNPSGPLHQAYTDKHQYLLKSSCHPSHTKRSIPFKIIVRFCKKSPPPVFKTVMMFL